MARLQYCFPESCCAGQLDVKRSSDRQEHRSIVVSGSTETPAAEESSGGLIVQRADSTAESASASTSSESSGDEGKRSRQKTNRNHRSAQGRMEALYDTVDGLTVERLLHRRG